MAIAIRAGATAGVIVGAAAMLVATPQDAQALASFARQVGVACGACHTDFPQLTPFGRRFKLGGYTMGGGQNSDEYKRTFGSDKWMPPISVMGIVGFTRTQASQLDENGLPVSNNFDLLQVSGFYGGAITENIGAFVQVTGGQSHFSWDNADVRYASTGTFFGSEAIYGITAHNNPTVQDVWNTVPAWGFPFIQSSFAPTPAAATIIEGNLAGRVLGVGAYTFINDMFYAEVTAYKGLGHKAQSTLGVWENGNLTSVMDRFSPYFRVAVEPHWENHWLMVGAFVLQTAVNPLYVDMLNFDSPLGYTIAGTDKFTDVGFDAQYQYMGNNYVLTLRSVYIHETQRLDSTFVNGFSDNPTNKLNTFKAQASLAVNTDVDGNKWIFTGGYFNTWGTTDCTLYCSTDPITGNLNGSPNSDGWIAEIAYFPYAMGRSPLWPWFNARVGLQYIWYNKFNGASVNYDGNGRNASDNNTLFAYVWFAM